MSSSTSYDRQLVVALLASEDDQSILAQGLALNDKHRELALASEIVTLHCRPLSGGARHADGVDALRRALAGQRDVPRVVGGDSRIYLVASCSAADRTLASWPADALANLLAETGLHDVALISIVADEAGRDLARSDDAQIEPGAYSFASALHDVLWTAHGIRTIVHARTGRVLVVEQAHARCGTLVEAGRKLTTSNPGNQSAQHHAPHSKLRLWWDGEVQRRDWAY